MPDLHRLEREAGVAGLLHDRESGRWDRLVPSACLLSPPGLRLDLDTPLGPALQWDLTDLVWTTVMGSPASVERRLASRGLLEEFLALEGADAPAFLRFAERYGVLGLCEHGQPFTHNRPDPEAWDECIAALTDILSGEHILSREGMELLYEAVPMSCAPESIELLDDWRALVRKARGLVSLASELHQGRPGAPDDWRVAGIGRDDVPDSLAGQRARFASVVTATSESWGTRLDFRWEPAWGNGEPDVTVGGRTLAAALGRELLLVTGKRSGLAVCAACGRAFPPKRKPRAGTRSYCSPRCYRRQSRRDERARVTDPAVPPNLG